MKSLSIANIPSNDIKRIPVKYIAAAAGLALAVSALGAFWPAGSSMEPVGSARQTTPEFTRSVERAHHYFYVVATEAERGELLREGAANAVVTGSEAHQALVGYGAAELVAANVEFTIIDTTEPRPASRAVPAATASDQGASALRSEIASLVTQQEQFEVGLMASMISKASDADIAASVLSTEKASFGD
jgi:hypothetical protein